MNRNEIINKLTTIGFRVKVESIGSRPRVEDSDGNINLSFTIDDFAFKNDFIRAIVSEKHIEFIFIVRDYENWNVRDGKKILLNDLDFQTVINHLSNESSKFKQWIRERKIDEII